MPRIPNKQRKSFTITNEIELALPGSEHYTGFTFQIIGLTAGIQVQLLASLDNGANFGVLDATFATTSAAGSVEVLELHAPCPGGLKLDFAGNLVGGTIIVFMHEPAFSSMTK